MEEFPDSPRVQCLRGMRIEADCKPGEALNFYEAALREDDTNAVRFFNFRLKGSAHTTF